MTDSRRELNISADEVPADARDAVIDFATARLGYKKQGKARLADLLGIERNTLDKLTMGHVEQIAVHLGIPLSELAISALADHRGWYDLKWEPLGLDAERLLISRSALEEPQPSLHEAISALERALQFYVENLRGNAPALRRAKHVGNLGSVARSGGAVICDCLLLEIVNWISVLLGAREEDDFTALEDFQEDTLVLALERLAPLLAKHWRSVVGDHEQYAVRVRVAWRLSKESRRDRLARTKLTIQLCQCLAKSVARSHRKTEKPISVF